jgi:general stress protein 26
MADQDLRRMCLRLIEGAWPAILSTVDGDGHPQMRAVFNLRNKERFPKLIPFFESRDDVFYIIITTNTSSSKVREVEANPKASVYFCQAGESRGLMLGGSVETVGDDDIKKAIWHEGWERYYPGGYNDPDHTVLRLYPRIAKGWDQSKTFEFMIDDE